MYGLKGHTSVCQDRVSFSYVFVHAPSSHISRREANEGSRVRLMPACVCVNIGYTLNIKLVRAAQELNDGSCLKLPSKCGENDVFWASG